MEIFTYFQRLSILIYQGKEAIDNYEIFKDSRLNLDKLVI